MSGRISGYVNQTRLEPFIWEKRNVRRVHHCYAVNIKTIWIDVWFDGPDSNAPDSQRILLHDHRFL